MASFMSSGVKNPIIRFVDLEGYYSALLVSYPASQLERLVQMLQRAYIRSSNAYLLLLVLNEYLDNLGQNGHQYDLTDVQPHTL